MEQKQEGLIQELIKSWKERKLRKKERELKELRLKIEQTKLEKELQDIANG